MSRHLALAIGIVALGLAPAARADVLTKVASMSELALIDGLTGVEHVVVSPDDRIVCVTATGDQSIACHGRDATSGQLANGDVEKDGVGGVDGIETPGEPGFDSGGRHLYVPGEGEDALAAFEVATDGELTWVETQREGFAGVAGLDAPVVARVSPDGAYVYAAGTTAIAIFERDSVTGGFDWIAQQVLPDLIEDTAAMELSPDGATLYLATDQDTLHAYARSAATGLLTLVDTEERNTGGLGDAFQPRSIVVARDGRKVYAASRAQIAVFDRSPDGMLTPVQQQFVFAGTDMALAGDGLGLWVSWSDVGGVATFNQDYVPIDPATGQLGTKQNGIFQAKNMTGGRIAASRDGRHLYVSDAWNDGPLFMDDGPPVIDVLSVEPLAFVEKQGDGVDGVDGLDYPIDVAVSPDGRHVYVAGREEHAVAIFARDAATGTLDFVEVVRDGVNGVDGIYIPTDITISPDGKHVYVCGYGDDAVAVFSRDATTGALSFVEQEKDGLPGTTFLDGAWASAVSPDGTKVFVVSLTDDAITSFSRDPVTGALAAVGARIENVAGVSGLDGPGDVAVSPDGANVYVSSEISYAVAVFAVTAAPNPLSFVTRYDDTFPTDQLARPQEIAVSPDGRNVYVVSGGDDAITVFGRNPDGTLFVSQELTDTTGVIDGLDGARGLAIAPDGGHVYVTGELSDALAVFRRDPETGLLGFAQVEFDVVPTDGLEDPNGVAPSPDGRHVYVAAAVDNALTVFAPEPGAAAGLLAAIGALALLRAGRRAR